jgi:hypothetical protein
MDPQLLAGKFKVIDKAGRHATCRRERSDKGLTTDIWKGQRVLVNLKRKYLFVGIF